MVGTGLIIAGSILVFLTLVFVGWLIGIYNTFVVARQDLKEMWSNITTEYQRRADLFLNLVESVKSFKKFEQSTLVEVVQARGGNFGSTRKEQEKKLGELDGIMGKLMLVFERYPELKSAERYKDLMDELRTTENRINIARTDFNETVRDYNVLIKTFPANLAAPAFGFLSEEYFETDEDVSKAPRLNLEEQDERKEPEKKKSNR